MKAMRVIEEGDALLGSGAEVNLESQVCRDLMSCFFLASTPTIKV